MPFPPPTHVVAILLSSWLVITNVAPCSFFPCCPSCGVLRYQRRPKEKFWLKHQLSFKSAAENIVYGLKNQHEILCLIWGRRSIDNIQAYQLAILAILILTTMLVETVFWSLRCVVPNEAEEARSVLRLYKNRNKHQKEHRNIKK